jgi:hypothetical protein
MLDLPNDLAREAWYFLIPYVEPARAYVFSRPAYAWEGLDPAKVTVIPPSTDAFSEERSDVADKRHRSLTGRPVTAVVAAAADRLRGACTWRCRRWRTATRTR